MCQFLSNWQAFLQTCLCALRHIGSKLGMAYYLTATRRTKNWLGGILVYVYYWNLDGNSREKHENHHESRESVAQPLGGAKVKQFL